MFKTSLMISLAELAETMEDEELEYDMQRLAITSCAFPIYVDDLLYDADDMSYEARISRWVFKNCGLNKTTIYVEVEY